VPAQIVGLPLLLRSIPSDDRATFVEGNVVLCSGAGFPGTIQMGSPTNTSASDGNVAGTVQANAGTIQPGQGEEVNVALINPNAAIDAVVVKGGNGFNVYSNPTFLPPTLPPDQHYISPLTSGGIVPIISHWFICYHLTTPPLATGSLTVGKTVIAPIAPPATPIPTTFTAVVNCNDNDPAHQNVVVTFSIGGGRSAAPTLTGIPVGTVCTVVETTASLPPGTTVTYDPAGADTTGVTIGAGPGVTVTITNDFSGLAPQTGNLQLVKTVLPAPPGVTLPVSYTARVVCDDGTDANVTFPGGGGDGTPLLSVAAGALCALAEDTTPLPAGWVVTYSVNGAPAGSSPPVFNVAGNGTVTVTITNDPTAVSPVSTTPTTPEPTAAPTMPDTLPPTGASADAPLALGLLLVATGLVTIGCATRQRRTHYDD
jgi:hypothetical protein